MSKSKTMVEITIASPHKEWKIKDRGFIDGYVRGGDGSPCAVVCIYPSQNFVLVPIYGLKHLP